MPQKKKKKIWVIISHLFEQINVWTLFLLLVTYCAQLYTRTRLWYKLEFHAESCLRDTEVSIYYRPEHEAECHLTSFSSGTKPWLVKWLQGHTLKKDGQVPRIRYPSWGSAVVSATFLHYCNSVSGLVDSNLLQGLNRPMSCTLCHSTK